MLRGDDRFSSDGESGEQHNLLPNVVQKLKCQVDKARHSKSPIWELSEFALQAQPKPALLAYPFPPGHREAEFSRLLVYYGRSYLCIWMRRAGEWAVTDQTADNFKTAFGMPVGRASLSCRLLRGVLDGLIPNPSTICFRDGNHMNLTEHNVAYVADGKDCIVLGAAQRKQRHRHYQRIVKQCREFVQPFI